MKTPRESIGIQEPLRPVKMGVVSNREHTVAMERLEQMDQILRQSYLESQVIDLHWERCYKEATCGVRKAEKKARIEAQLWRNQARLAREAVSALRVNLLRHELGMPSVRELSLRISGNEAYAHFCGMLDGDRVKGSSKSRLDRLSRLFSEEQLRQLHGTFLTVIGSAEHCVEVGLETAVSMETSLVDGTCIEANIHHPTDWILLGDVGCYESP